MRCPCGGEVPSALREAPEAGHVIAETLLDDCEAATGERPSGCPWRAFADPYVAEVLRAHRWWKSGQLATRYPTGVPAPIAWGVEVYDVALNTVQVVDMRADREKRDEARREREANRPR
jgi:hypothetical protein